MLRGVSTHIPAPEQTGIPGSDLPGPYGVGEYASTLAHTACRLFLFAQCSFVGELVNLSVRPVRA